MEFSRVLIVSILFLIIWKDTLSQQTYQGNHLLKRCRRNQESDRDEYLKRVNQLNNEGETKSKPTEPANLTYSSPRVQTRSSNLGKVPQKIVRIRPLHVRNNNNIVSTQPDVLFANNLGLADKNYEHNEVNETLINHITEAKNVGEKKQMVDEVVNSIVVDKKLSTISEKNMNKNSDKPEEEIANLKPKEPQIFKSKVKSKPKKEFKTKKPYDENNNEEKIITVISSLKVTDSSLNKENNEIKHDVENQVDGKITEDVSIEQEQKTKSVKTESTVVPRQDDKISPKKHLFHKRIQNDLRINSPINKNDSTDEVSLRSGNNEALEKSTIDLNSIGKLLLSRTNENNDEDEGILVTKNNYEEVMEINRLSKVPVTYQLNTVQDTIDPVIYDYNYEVPHNEGTPVADSNNNINPYTENKQRIDQIDGTSVLSYNNYFQLPATNSNWNNRNPYYPSYNLNNYRKYGYQGYGRPSSNIENYRNDKDKVWRSWQNTQYYLKSKNVLKPLLNEKL